MTCNSDFPSYHTLMGSLLEVTTVLSHFILLTLLTGPRLNRGLLSPNPLYFDCHESGFESIRAQFEFSDSPWPALSPPAISQSEASIVRLWPIRGQEPGSPVSESSRRNISPDGRLSDTNPQTLLSFNYVKTKYLSNATTCSNALFSLSYELDNANAMLWSLTHVHVCFSIDITCDVFSSLLMQTIVFSPQLSGQETELRWIMSMLFFVCVRKFPSTRPTPVQVTEMAHSWRKKLDLALIMINKTAHDKMSFWFIQV